MNLLHFDVEGGWGGSSISLLEIVKKLKHITMSIVFAGKKVQFKKNIKMKILNIF